MRDEFLLRVEPGFAVEGEDLAGASLTEPSSAAGDLSELPGEEVKCFPAVELVRLGDGGSAP